MIPLRPSPRARDVLHGEYMNMKSTMGQEEYHGARQNIIRLRDIEERLRLGL